MFNCVKWVKMRVNSVGQENNSKTSSVLKAGGIGAIGGAVVRNLAPLTTEEHDFFFNSSAVSGIEQKVRKVRANEIEKIANEFKAGKLSVTKNAFDTFEKHKDLIQDEPKSALGYIKNASDDVKRGVSALVNRVDAIGAAKEHIEVSNIKSAAKSQRPLTYFALAGALIAMSGQVLVNAFKSCMPETEKTAKEQEPLTMADVLLEGLGTNTEVLFLTNEAFQGKH